MKHSYTESILKEAIASSTSIRQALLKLGLKGEGGNYRVIHKAIKDYSIDISHFTGKGWRHGKKFSPKKPLASYLSNEYTIQSHRLRLRLLKEGIFKPECQSCFNTTWLDLPISLELDHIDGNHFNNELSNLRLLCPNCHAQTNTWKGRNKKLKA